MLMIYQILLDSPKSMPFALDKTKPCTGLSIILSKQNSGVRIKREQGNFGNRYTLEEMSARSGLYSNTVRLRKVICAD
jgi:hypothetical protein